MNPVDSRAAGSKLGGGGCDSPPVSWGGDIGPSAPGSGDEDESDGGGDGGGGDDSVGNDGGGGDSVADGSGAQNELAMLSPVEPIEGSVCGGGGFDWPSGGVVASATGCDRFTGDGGGAKPD